MITAVIFYAAPDLPVGEHATGLVQMSTTIATCVFGTVGLLAHGSAMETRKKDKGIIITKAETVCNIFGILGFLFIMTTPVLFLCGMGPAVGFSIGSAGIFMLLILPIVVDRMYVRHHAYPESRYGSQNKGKTLETP